MTIQWMLYFLKLVLRGIITATLAKLELGITLKIADGSACAPSEAFLANHSHLDVLSNENIDKLQAHIRPPILNFRSHNIGEIC